MFKSSIFGGVLILCVCSTWCTYQDCGSVDGTVIALDIAGCSNTTRRCPLKRNTNASIEIIFKPNMDVTNLKAIVHGYILGVPTPFDLPNPDACTDSGLTCPLKAGESYKYVTHIPVKAEYPRITVDIKWELQTEGPSDVVCQMIPAKLT